ncbi:hypothetical protein KJS94_03555 [Flavihumibacter rivuli]|uniref:hypothetical protein n=1 Tax=Flavihumibacter rivuli TaxID=2838156 RepID=UPI001BDEB2DD|nr:hypothetical protein [Flavihumibacter rivuli]ULQ57275.1 hypothetical protein KJS94_03555 [Flavihumibacter rivuli]
MPAIHNIRKQLQFLYLAGFVLMAVVRSANGLWLGLADPVLYADTYNLVTWGLRLSGFLHWLTQHPVVFGLLDIAYVVLNLGIIATALFRPFNRCILLLLCYNFCYASIAAACGLHTVEMQLSWLLMPLLFLHIHEKHWIQLFHFMRAFFLFYFASAGIWKLLRGSLFSKEHFVNVLLLQHKELLALDPDGWQAEGIYWLVNHPLVCQLVFVLATAIELFFLAGFFTLRFDRLLFWLYVAFVVADIFLMRILYAETIPLAMVLLFSAQLQEKVEHIMNPAKATIPGR